MREEELLQVIEEAARDQRQSLDLSTIDEFTVELTNLPAEIGNLISML